MKHLDNYKIFESSKSDELKVFFDFNQKLLVNYL